MIETFELNIKDKSSVHIFVGMSPVFVREENLGKLDQIAELAACSPSLSVQLHFDSAYKTNELITNFIHSKKNLKSSFGSHFEDDIIDIVFTFGGDGSVLWAHKVLQNQTNAVYISFNTGHLGYLSFMDINSMEEIMHDLKAHFVNRKNPSKIHFSSYSKVKCEIKNQVGETLNSFSAINEISTHRFNNYSVIYKVYWNDRFLASINADGLIICSSLGSTAYNSSVNGPILLQNNNNLVLSAIAPFGINFRSIVFNENDMIRIEISEKAFGDVCNIVGDSNLGFQLRLSQWAEISIDKKNKIHLASRQTAFEEQWIQKVAKIFKWD
jgi:NAD kinase